MISHCFEPSKNPVAIKEAKEFYTMITEENKKIMEIMRDTKIDMKEKTARVLSFVATSALTTAQRSFSTPMIGDDLDTLKDMLKLPRYKMMTVSLSSKYPNDAIVCFGSVKITKETGMAGAIEEVFAISYPPQVLQSYSGPTKIKFHELEGTTDPLAIEAVKLIKTLSDPEFRTDDKEELIDLVKRINPPQEVVDYITLADLEYIGDCFSDIDNKHYMPLMATDPGGNRDKGIIYIIPMPDLEARKIGNVGPMWQNVKWAKAVSLPLRQKTG